MEYQSEQEQNAQMHCTMAQSARAECYAQTSCSKCRDCWNFMLNI